MIQTFVSTIQSQNQFLFPSSLQTPTGGCSTRAVQCDAAQALADAALVGTGHGNKACCRWLGVKWSLVRRVKAFTLSRSSQIGGGGDLSGSWAKELLAQGLVKQWDRFSYFLDGFHKKCARTRHVELVFLHPVKSLGRVVHSSASRTQHVDAPFFVLGWYRCYFYYSS
jgi:hypothetical protein